MGETEENFKDEIELKKEKDRAEDGAEHKEEGGDLADEEGKQSKEEKKNKKKKEKKENGEGEDKEKKKKNPADKKDPTKLQAKLEKLDSKIHALQAKKEEILKLIEEAKQAAENPTQ